MTRAVFLALMTSVAFILSACESDPVTTGEPASTAAIKPIDVMSQKSQPFNSRSAYKP